MLLMLLMLLKMLLEMLLMMLVLTALEHVFKELELRLSPRGKR